MNDRLGGFKRRWWLACLFSSALLFCLLSASPLSLISHQDAWLSRANAEANISQLVDEGVAAYRAGDYQAAIAHWQTALQLDQDKALSADRAVLLENLARIQGQIGRSYEAVDYWEQAIAVATTLGDTPQTGRLLTEQAQAYSRLGQYRQAVSLLCGNLDATGCQESSAVKIAQLSNDRTGEAAALGSLGEALRLSGRYDEAIAALNRSLTISQADNHIPYEISTLQSLGNIYVNLSRESYRRVEATAQAGDATDRLEATAKAEDREAQRHFEASLALAQQHSDGFSKVRSHLSLIPIYRRLGELSQAESSLQAVRQSLPQLPQSHEKIYALVTLANLIQFTAGEDNPIAQCFQGMAQAETQALLTSAAEQAQAIGDRRGEAFALGTLGHWQECQQNYSPALQLTQQAQWIADQQRQGQDSLYLWQWQLGRILLAQGQTAEAIQAYEQAVATLDDLRRDLLVSDRELQFDFRDTVEPIYRQLIALQLGESPTAVVKSDASAVTADLGAALMTVESLRLAELQNYFGSDCEVIPFAEIQQGLVGSGSATAVMTSVLLGDRTAMIASFPNGDRQYAWIPVDDGTLRNTLNEYRRGLERFFDALTEVDLQQSQQLYDWLIRPFADRLTADQVETLVFVNDGLLRSVPMAALHDGQQFLVESYAIATIPTLSLTATSSLDPQQMRALLTGLTQRIAVGGQVFRALEYVDDEVEAIRNQVPSSQLLLDESFNLEQLKTELTTNQYSVLHMATHGKFGAEPEDTFLVTGQGEKLTLAEMERLIRGMSNNAEPIDLLALTACETAIGDERAALGLGGVAVRAGAKSAIASLWTINDATTAELSADFYRGFISGQLSKAKALQTAQIKMIQADRHPGFWAPYVLVGNWL